MVEKSNHGFTTLLMGYAQSSFQDYESYPGTGKVPDDDIEMIFKKRSLIFYQFWTTSRCLTQNLSFGGPSDP